MKRREFLTAAGAGIAASTAVAMPAIAQTQPEVRWRCTASFQKSQDTLYGTVENFARRMAEMSDGKFQVQVFAAGEIVPGLQALDAVQNKAVEMCFTASYYYVGKDPTFAFGSTIPFGLNTRQFNAWLYYQGGLELLNTFYQKYNVHMLPAGNTGAQMGGWFRKELKNLDDLKGLKMRIAGLGGQVLSRLGVVPQQLAGADIYPSLERGTIDAAEWVGPYDDEKLGLYKVAPYYYYPGWWEGCAGVNYFINQDEWKKLPKVYQAMVEAAAAEANNTLTARYDAENPVSIQNLVKQGALLRRFPNDVLEAAYKAANELYAEISETNPDFRKAWDQIKAVRSSSYLWWQIGEFSYDDFMVRARARGG
ncbi:TRAP transporter substrate-binding protein [Xanthobacter sp. TB0136]|uniref:TRAP transporter substrate-binding protein n=1 Tax=Xanthobacter sp. TB0136 TaxID=3459177 RepID=UPI0040395FB2